MSLTMHVDFSQPLLLYNARDQSVLVSADGDLLRTAVMPSNSGLGQSTSGTWPDNAPKYRTAANGIEGQSISQWNNGVSGRGILAVLGGSGPTSFLVGTDVWSASAGTAMFVFRQTADSESGNPGTTNGGFRIFEDSGITFALRTYTNTGVQQVYGTVTDGGTNTVGPVVFERDVAQLVTLRHAGGNLYLSINGGTETSITNGNSAGLSTNVWIGYSFVYDRSFTGDMCEYMFWNTGDADGDLSGEQNALMAKWGIGGGDGMFPALSVAL